MDELLHRRQIKWSSCIRVGKKITAFLLTWMKNITRFLPSYFCPAQKTQSVWGALCLPVGTSLIRLLTIFHMTLGGGGLGFPGLQWLPEVVAKSETKGILKDFKLFVYTDAMSHKVWLMSCWSPEPNRIGLSRKHIIRRNYSAISIKFIWSELVAHVAYLMLC